MKKILIIITLLVAIVNMLLAEDMQLQEISLDEFLNNHLVDYKIEKQIQLEGIGRDFAVAENTGDVVAVTEVDNNYCVYFFDMNGILKWKREFTGKGYEINCLISYNGKAIVIVNYISGFAKNTVLDNLGNLLFEKKLKNLKLKPTPNGQYFYEEVGMVTYKKQCSYLYNRFGNEIELTGFDFANEEDIRFLFLSDTQVISYLKNKLIFFEFNDGNMKRIWQYNLETYHPFDDFFHKSIKFTNKYIAVFSHTPEGLSYIFDYDGKLIYTDQFYQAFDFINSEQIIAGRRFIDDTKLRKLNIDTLEFTDYNYLFGANYFQNIICTRGSTLFCFNYFLDFKDNGIIITNSMDYTPSFSFFSNIEAFNNKLFILTENNTSKLIVLGRKNEN
jgi:hypothetical protein